MKNVNSPFSQFIDKLKATSFFKKISEKDSYAEELYYFKSTEDSNATVKRIKIDLEPVWLSWVEKIKYYGFWITKKTYVFKTTDPLTGKIKTGLIKAKNDEDVENQIEKIYNVKGYWYEPYLGNTFLEKFLNNPLFFLQWVSKKEIYMFTQRLSDLISSWVELRRSLETIKNNIKNKRFKEILSDVIEITRGWESLPTALSKYPQQFNNFYVSMVWMAEKSWKLGASLYEISLQLKKEIELNWRIKSALIMPFIIILAVMGMTYFMFTFLIPTLAILYADMNTELPWATKLAIGISENLKNNWIFYLIFILLIPVFYVTINKVPVIKEKIDLIKMHLPIFWVLIRWKEQIQFLRILAPMMDANAEIEETLKICWKASNNEIYKQSISQIANGFKNGKDMYVSMKKNIEIIDSKVWDSDLIIAVQTGYETAKISYILIKSSEVLERQLDEYQRNIEKLINPFILLFIVLIVWFILYAAFSPIYSWGLLSWWSGV